MPVILKPGDYDRWLEPGDPHQLPTDLLRPFPAELMKAWKVSKDVGNVRNNHPGLCVESLVGDEELPMKPDEQPPVQGDSSSNFSD